MPVRPTLDIISVRYHTSPTELLSLCQNDFKLRERDANIVYPFLLKAKAAESTSTSSTAPSNHGRRNTIRSPIVRSAFPWPPTDDSDTSSDEESSSSSNTRPMTGHDDQFWITVWTSRGRLQQAKLDLVLSCTNGPVGKYPIFLYSNVDDEHLTPEWIAPRMQALVNQLRWSVSSRRVFSVFGPVPLTQSFVAQWTALTGATPILEPYYAAKHTFCTTSTLTSPTSPISPTHTLRLAASSDLLRAAELCWGFAAGSAPFVLSSEDAVKEARGYIANRQMYVYEIGGEVTTIVCVTRSSAGVGAITKVYSDPKWRGRRCAERLVRYVCQQLLSPPPSAATKTPSKPKDAVVLFVAHDNKAAEKVYNRVGFRGLCGKRDADVSDWVEVGFEDTELGHW